MDVHDVPSETWTAEYNRTRVVGSQVYWLLDKKAAGTTAPDGAGLHYYGEVGTGMSGDNNLNSDPYPTDSEATLIRESAGSSSPIEDIKWELSVEDQTIFKHHNLNQEDLYKATTETFHAYYEERVVDQTRNITSESN
jgi:hypothetical protein